MKLFEEMLDHFETDMGYQATWNRKDILRLQMAEQLTRIADSLEKLVGQSDKYSDDLR